MARLEELERKFEENPRRYFAPLANEYRKAGDALRAAELCRAQLPEVPGHISGHIVLGQALYDARDFDGSRAALETALALDPENIVALRYLGDIARDTGDAAEAERWYSRTLEADPYNEAATSALQLLRAAPAPAPEPEPESGSVPDDTRQVTEETPRPEIDSQAVGYEPTSYAEPELSESVETSQPMEVAPPADIADAFPTEAPTTELIVEEYAEVPEATERAPAAAAEFESAAAGVLTVTGEFAGDLSVSTTPEPTEFANDEPSAAPETTELVSDEPVASEPASAEPPAVEPAEERFDVAAHAPPEAEMPEPVTLEPVTLEPVTLEPVTPEQETLEEAIQAEERVLESAAPFVTETMADLYLEQGYPHEALELLLQLSEQRPQDEQLRGKIEHIESVIVARRDAAVAAARAERAEAAEPTEPTEPDAPDAPFDVAVAEVAYSAFAPSEPEPEPELEPEPEPPSPISVSELFARMDSARPRAAGSVTPRPISRRRSDFVPMPEGQATASEASDDPFAFPNPPASTPVPRTSGPQPTFNPSTADTDDFNAWLRGLRGP